MTNDKIKQKLLSLMLDYHNNSAGFQGQVIIRDFIAFLKSEPFTMAIIEPHLKYINEQVAVTRAGAVGKELKDINFVVDINAVNHIAGFKKEAEMAKSAMEADNINALTPEMGLPVFLSSLLLIHDYVNETQSNGAKNDGSVDERLAKINQVPNVVLNNKTVPTMDGKDILLTAGTFFAVAMANIMKIIINKIDSEQFLSGATPQVNTSFDVESSILKIKGAEVKIARRGDPPIEHFVLVGLFSQADIADPLEFHCIARDIMKDEDYEPAKGWAKFRSACDRLNQKVDKSTNGEIKDFIEYTTGRTGWCKINPKDI